MHYWASPIETKLCSGQEVALVGAGTRPDRPWSISRAMPKSVAAGARQEPRSEHVAIPGRSDSRLPNVEVLTKAQVTGLEGGTACSKASAGARARQGDAFPIRHLFLFIGAEPNTNWLSGSGITLDPKGFVVTGADAGKDAARWRRAARASSRSVTCVRVRSSASRRVSAKARRSSRRCMAISRKPTTRQRSARRRRCWQGRRRTPRASEGTIPPLQGEGGSSRQRRAGWGSAALTRPTPARFARRPSPVGEG